MKENIKWCTKMGMEKPTLRDGDDNYYQFHPSTVHLLLQPRTKDPMLLGKEVSAQPQKW
jgi:hypothetical protein